MGRPLHLGSTWTLEQAAQAVALIDQILALGPAAYHMVPPPPPGPDGTIVVSFFPHRYHQAVDDLMELTRQVPGNTYWSVSFPEDEKPGYVVPEGGLYETEPGMLARSSLNQIWRYLAFLTRAEHWNSGAYADAIEDGRLAVTRNRLQDLLEEEATA